jgi:TPR repeat protein
MKGISLAAFLSFALTSVAWGGGAPLIWSQSGDGTLAQHAPIEAMTLEGTEELAKGGDAEMQYQLARIYDQGRDGAPLDYAAAAKWYRLAAEQGHKEAQWQLSLFFEHGKGGVMRDIVEACKWAGISIAGEPHGSELSQQRSSRIHRLRWQLPVEQLAEVESWINAWQATPQEED